MTRHASLALLLVALMAVGCGSDPAVQTNARDDLGPFTEAEVTAAITDLLLASSDRALDRVAVPDGYWSNLDLRIPLPDDVRQVGAILRDAGQGQMVDDMHLALNRAAELAAADSEALLTPLIVEMRYQHPGRVLHGPENAATMFFRQSNGNRIDTAYRPLIERHLIDQRGYQVWSRTVADRIRHLGFENTLTTDLTVHTSNEAQNGLFRAMAAEEAAIRSQPEKRSTPALRTVFADTVE
jgi:hypothetical protein